MPRNLFLPIFSNRSFRALAGVLFVASLATASSQTYTYNVSKGARPFIAEMRPNAVLVYPPPKDDVLSEWVPLPFSWNLYGSPVTGFFISDNGYITFDGTAVSSDPQNRALPSPDAPRSAIFAFWEDLHTESGFPQWSNEVRTLLWGTAPNRVFVIMWIGVVPHGVGFSSSNTLSFAIALHEGGDFEIIFVGGNTSVRCSAAIGVQNADGTIATQVPGSPDIPYPAVTADPSDDIGYRFTWSNTALDLGIYECSLPPTVTIGIPQTIRGTLKNFGSREITGFDIVYRVDGGPEFRDSVRGIRIGTNETLAFSHVSLWTPTEAGRFHDVLVTVGNVNGQGLDENPANDSTSMRIFTILGKSGEKHVLVEEFTGTWCGWCPDGSLQMQAIQSAVRQAVLVAIHAGGVDSMIAPEGANLASAFTPSYPQAMVDRVQFPGQSKVPINRSGNAWLSRTLERMQAATPVTVGIAPAYDPATRKVTVDVTVRFEDYVPPGEDLRLHVFIVEDRVVGTGPGWDQTNYYSNNSCFPTHPYYGESNPIVGFMHRHVLRASLTGVWGIPLQQEYSPGSTRTERFTKVLQRAWKEQDIVFVAFVGRHDSAITQRSVLNAAKAPLLVGTFVESSTPYSFQTGEIFPNPSHGTVFLPIETGSETRVRVEIFDAIGRLVTPVHDEILRPGHHLIQVPFAPSSYGMHWVRIESGDRITVKAVAITP
ncbi:MAG: Omp28-related outer membrane protein [Bacteroidota bacterium]|nr:Omp28-related outer membrane protein [Bacteroidota bacterium]